jgi:MmgE/PrpD C-terminal domain
MAGVAQMLGNDRLQPEPFIQLADQNETGIGGDARSLKRNLQKPVEDELKRLGFFLTHRVSPILAGQLAPDEALERLMPQRTAIVEVTLTDGSMVSERVGTVRGTAANPMTRDDVIAKARDLIVPVLGSAAFQKLADRVFDLEHVNNVIELRPLLQRT